MNIISGHVFENRFIYIIPYKFPFYMKGKFRWHYIIVNGLWNDCGEKLLK